MIPFPGTETTDAAQCPPGPDNRHPCDKARATLEKWWKILSTGRVSPGLTAAGTVTKQMFHLVDQTAAAVASGALTPVTNQNQDDRGKTVIPFPGTRPDTDADVCENDDPDGPDECELLYNFLIIEEIKIRNDTIAPPGVNQIAHAATIRARKLAWNQLVNEYNIKCVKRGLPPIGYRL